MNTYRFRLMAQLPGDTPIEIMRETARHYIQADWDFWTRDLLDRWHCWVEIPLRDKDCLTSRPTLSKSGSRATLHERKGEARESRGRLYAS